MRLLGFQLQKKQIFTFSQYQEISVKQKIWKEIQKIYYFQQYILMMHQELLPIKKKEQTRSIYSTNQVLVQEQSNRTIYYLPCYVRFKVRQILEVDIQKLQANLSGTLLFSFYYGKLNKKILKELISKQKCRIRLQITAKDPIILKEQDGIFIKRDKEESLMHYRIRKQFTCILKSEVDYSPFQILNLHLTVIVQKVTIDPDEEEKKEQNNQKGTKPTKKIDDDLEDKLVKRKKIDIKFNFMDAEDVDIVISGRNLNFKDYYIAKYFLEAKFHNTDAYLFQKIQILKNSLGFRSVDHPIQTFTKINEYRYANFRIPLYKNPGASLIQIFVPLWILGFITLLIFFQQPSLSGRISIIATLTLAFIAFIPVINTQIPKTSNIKLVQVLIYMETITTILCLIDSLTIFMQQNQQSPPYVFIWEQDPLFLASMAINIANIFLVFTLFGIHKFYWEIKYISSQNKTQTGDTINRKMWSNLDCDDHFLKFINDKKVRVI